MRRNWRATLGLLLVLVLGAAACGGDDGGSSDEESSTETTEAEEAISEDEWVEEADGLCEDWLDVTDETDGSDPDEVADLAEAAGEFRDGVEELGEPEGLEDEAAEFVDTLDELAENLDEAATQLEEEGELTEELNEAGRESFDAVVTAADEAGLECDIEGISTADASDDFSDDLTSDFSDDTSSDFSDDPSTDGGFDGEALDPEIFIPEFGTDPALDELALDCESGDFAACDRLYFDSPVEQSTGSYEGYGATCGGRLVEEDSGNCQTIAANG